MKPFVFLPWHVCCDLDALCGPCYPKLVKVGILSVLFSAESPGLSTAPGKCKVLSKYLLQEHVLDGVHVSLPLCPCWGPGTWFLAAASNWPPAYILLCLQSILHAEGPHRPDCGPPLLRTSKGSPLFLEDGLNSSAVAFCSALS